MTDEIKKPEGFTDEHLVYMDEFHGAKTAPMVKVGPYLETTFALSPEQAREYMVYWMRTYQTRHPKPVV